MNKVVIMDEKDYDKIVKLAQDIQYGCSTIDEAINEAAKIEFILLKP